MPWCRVVWPVTGARGRHLEAFVDEPPSSRVFTGPLGAALQRQNFNKLVGWTTAVEKIGMPGLHFHDLRHTGNHLAAATRASTRDLMARMGHDSLRAALIYQHATSEAGRAIAAAIDAQVKVAAKDAKKRARRAGHKDRAERDHDGDGGPSGRPGAGRVMAR
jgi:integrase